MGLLEIRWATLPHAECSPRFPDFVTRILQIHDKLSGSARYTYFRLRSALQPWLSVLPSLWPAGESHVRRPHHLYRH